MPQNIVLRNLTTPPVMASNPRISTKPGQRDGSRSGQGNPGNLFAPGVTGNVMDGQTITIAALSGESFGANGPSLNIYQDGRGAAEGGILTTGDPSVGQWSEVNRGDNTYFVTGGKVRPLALKVHPPLAKNVVMFTPATELFISFWMHIDKDPTLFAGSFKTVWVLDEDNAGDFGRTFEIVLMSKIDYTDRFQMVDNNPNTSTWQRTNNGEVNENEWVRCSFWLKDNGAAEMGYWHQIINDRIGQSVKDSILPGGQPMLQSSQDSTGVKQVHFAGHFNSNNNQSDVNLLLDGIYVATGATCRARVEIGEAQDYAACSELFLCTPTSWSDQQIQAAVRSKDGLNGHYIHIHDANGVHTNGGTGRLISA